MSDVVGSGGGSQEGVRAYVRRKVDAGAHDAQLSGSVVAPLGSPDNPSDKILTLANLITACRFALTLVFLVIFVSRQNRYVAVSCYAVAAITDFLDGQVARRTQTVSWLGKVMDPIIDRVLLFTGVLGLVITEELPVWVAVFVCGRDLVLGVGMLVLQRYRRRPIDVIFVGKLATALLMFGFSDMLLGVPMMAGLAMTDVAWLPGLNGSATPLGTFIVYIGVICSAYAMIYYIYAGLRIRREVLEAEGQG